jgi:hypothetical protein
MTSTIEAPPEATTTVDESKKRGRNPDRDFTKTAQRHQDLADFINASDAYAASGLPPITANVIKAVQLLTEDFRNQPEQVEARKTREAERKAEEAQYAGLSAEEKKELRAADRRAKNLQDAVAKRDALLAKAKEIREAASASGADIASAVESESEDSEPEKQRRGIRRR